MGRLAEDVEASPYGEVFDLTKVSVDVGEEIGELLGLLLDAEVAVELRIAEGLPDHDPYRWQLRGVERLYLVILVQQLLELCQIVVCLSTGHGWDQMVHDGRVRPPFGLRPLARVVYDKGIEERHVAQGGIGGARGGEAKRFARQPLQRTML